jgi:Tol biopolymer transport system component
VMNSDGTGLRQLTTIHGSNPQWFPTGQKLSFVAPVNGVSQIFTLDVANQGQPVQVTFSAGNKWYPAVDVDGLVLAFTSAEGSPDFDIWTVNVNGTAEARLFQNAGDDAFASWR